MNAMRHPYENLRINLLAHLDRHHAKTLMFVGASAGDGVSTTAIGFAQALAAGSVGGTVLVDANFRHPYLHKHFQVSGKPPGLVGLLAGDDPPTPAQTASPNLYVIPCGHDGTAEPPPFDSAQFGQFLADMKSRWDYVVVDAAPVLYSPESLCIAAKVDAVVMVVRAGTTRQKLAKRAKQQIEEVGGMVVGVVLNRRKYYIPEALYKFFLGQ